MRYLAFIVCVFVTPLVMAHEGHDHSHWSSLIVHALFLISLAMSGLACVFALYKAISRFQSHRD